MNKNRKYKKTEATSLLCLLFLSHTVPTGAADLAGAKLKLQHGDMQAVKKMDKEIASMSKLEKEELIKELTTLLKSADWQKQEKAAHMAGALGPDALPLLPLLISAMNSGMENVAWEAAPAIGKIGKAAVPTLVADLKKEDLKSRRARHLIAAIGELGSSGSAAVSTLAPFLADGANTGAVDALKKMGVSCIEPLAASLETAKDSRVWVYSCEIFSTSPEQSSTALASLLKSKEAARLEPATYILSKIASSAYSSCIPGLITAMLLNKANISDRAQEALIRIGPAASTALRKHALDDDIEVQKRVASVLQTIGKSSKTDIAAMEKGLSNKNAESAALTASTILKNDRNNKAAQDTLNNLLKSKDERTRSIACQACSKVGPNAVGTVTILIGLLKDPNPQVRMDAATAIGAIGAGAASATPALIIACTSTHPVVVQGHEAIGMDPSIQQAAITSLGQIGPKAAAAVPTLTNMLAQKENSYRGEYILKSLQGMKNSAAPAIPTLMQAWQNNSYSRLLLLDTFKSIGTASTKAIPLLQKSLDSPKETYRKDIFETILVLEPDTEKKRSFIRKYMSSTDYELSHAASSAYASLPASKSAASDLPALLAGLSSSQYDVKLNSIKALGKVGPAAHAALPKLIKDNIGCSFSQNEKTLAFEAIKQIDPSGDEVVPLLTKALEDPFQVRGACELLDFIGSAKTKPIAAATKAKWKL